MSDRQRNGFILLLVLGLLIASGVAIATQKTVLGLDLKGGVELVYQGKPTAQTPVVTQDALQRAVDIMRQRVDQLGVSEPQIQTAGGDISVGLPDVKDISRAEKIVGTTARLEFYDWEANALTPNGKTVASQLQRQDRTAMKISQGNGSTAPGEPGAGSLPLYEAVKLASKQPPLQTRDSSRSGPQYYLFGAPGSTACQTAAKEQGTLPVTGVHCPLSGPYNNPHALDARLPAGVNAAQGRRVKVPQGIAVLQAEDVTAAHATPFSSPAAQFYVLKEDPDSGGEDHARGRHSDNGRRGSLGAGGERRIPVAHRAGVLDRRAREVERGLVGVCAGNDVVPVKDVLA